MGYDADMRTILTAALVLATSANALAGNAKHPETVDHFWFCIGNLCSNTATWCAGKTCSITNVAYCVNAGMKGQSAADWCLPTQSECRDARDRFLISGMIVNGTCRESVSDIGVAAVLTPQQCAPAAAPTPVTSVNVVEARWWCVSTDGRSAQADSNCTRTKDMCEHYVSGLEQKYPLVHYADCQPSDAAACLTVKLTVSGDQFDECYPWMSDCKKQERYIHTTARDDAKLVRGCTATK